MAKQNEFLTPQERAKKFSTGHFTAGQTGAKAEAARHYANAMKASAVPMSVDQKTFEGVISGKQRLPR